MSPEIINFETLNKIDFGIEKPTIGDALRFLGEKSQKLPVLKEVEIQEGLCAQKDLDQFGMLFEKNPNNLKNFQNIFNQGCFNNPEAMKILGV